MILATVLSPRHLLLMHLACDWCFAASALASHQQLVGAPRPTRLATSDRRASGARLFWLFLAHHLLFFLLLSDLLASLCTLLTCCCSLPVSVFGRRFKSVFRVTEAPAVHSGPFHVAFDVSTDGALGYVLPTWVGPPGGGKQEGGAGASSGGRPQPPPEAAHPRWRTLISLPLKRGVRGAAVARLFDDVSPSLLLFLRSLRCIAVRAQLPSRIPSC